MTAPGVEPGLSRPRRDVLTTRRCGRYCSEPALAWGSKPHPAHQTFHIASEVICPDQESSMELLVAEAGATSSRPVRHMHCCNVALVRGAARGETAKATIPQSAVAHGARQGPCCTTCRQTAACVVRAFGAGVSDGGPSRATRPSIKHDILRGGHGRPCQQQARHFGPAASATDLWCQPTRALPKAIGSESTEQHRIKQCRQMLSNQADVCATLAQRRTADRNHKVRTHRRQLSQDPR